MRPLAAAAIATAITVGAIGVADGSHDPAYERAELVERGGLHGGDLYRLPLGEIRGVRDIQGGRHTGPRSNLNLDIGAGSTEHPGALTFNYDVGRCTVIFNGRRRRIARFCPDRIDFYVPVHRRAR